MADHEKLRILVVDDDPVDVLLMQRYLDATGHEILTATNGVEAMRIILDRGPQILITDWNMPEMDGLELCRNVRSNEGCGFIYIILVTAHTEGDRIVTAYAAGIDDLAKVRLGVIEPDGRFSFIRYDDEETEGDDDKHRA